MANILIACEKSRRVASAFEKLGHHAVSCDILPAEQEGEHIQDDVLKHLDDGWDMMIAHPDCTYLANSGVHWLSRQPGRFGAMVRSAIFFKTLLDTDIPLIVIENPIPHRYALEIIGKKYDQIVQPYRFGEDASKATCLWLKGLPPLTPTKFIEPHYACRCGSTYRFEYALGKYGCPNCGGEYTARAVWGNQTKSGQNRIPPSKARKTDRARTYQGVADAMANQWGEIAAKRCSQEVMELGL